jgi:pyrroline-5-carboxylate reductase
MNHENKKIAFIGGGMMAEAMIRGIILHGHNPNTIYASDPSEDRRNILSILNNQLNIENNNNKIALTCDVLFMAVKPQIFLDVAKNISQITQKQDPVIVSVAAGISLEILTTRFGKQSKICRVMPNQPCLVGKGVSALIAKNLVDDDKRLVTYLFNSVGKSIWLDNEDWMHAVTAISGSGPAYFYHIMELLTDSAISAGIPENIAKELVMQTAIGASELAHNSPDDVKTLRQKVSSPGGTTEAAFDSLDGNDIRSIWKQAIDAAIKRSIDLGARTTGDESNN